MEIQRGKWKSLSHVQLFVAPWIVHGILQARIPEWGSLSLLQGLSWSRDQTQVSLIAGGFFTSWATGKAQEYWSGEPFPSPADLPDPEIEPGSPALQANSLSTELSGKPYPKFSVSLNIPQGKPLSLLEFDMKDFSSQDWGEAFITTLFFSEIKI